MKSIAVIGAGTAGYLTVLFLCKKIAKSKKLRGYTVEWIYPKNGKSIGVGEATTNHVQDFLDDLGIDKREILTTLNGNLKLGLKFENFNYTGGAFIHPFGDNDIAAPMIEHIMKHNTVPDDILSYDSIATHFDVSVLKTYLDTVFRSFDNLKITKSTVTDINTLEHDVIVDCTGFQRHIMSQVIDDNFIDISNKIPNTKALVFRSTYTNLEDQRVAYTTCTGLDYGWCWNIPLKNEISFGYVHDGSYNVEEEFTTYLEKKLKTPIDHGKLREIKMRTGRNKTHIIKRGSKVFVSIGLSSCFIEPLESTGLHFVVDGIRLLGKYLQKKICIESFNTTMNNAFDSVLDFVIAHYKYSNNDNTYWNKYKLLDVQQNRDNSVFPPLSWSYVLRGMGQKIPAPLKGLPISTMLQLAKGTTYNKWIEDERYTR